MGCLLQPPGRLSCFEVPLRALWYPLNRFIVLILASSDELLVLATMWDLAKTFFHRESTKALKGIIHSSWRSFRNIHLEEGWQRGWGQSDRWWDLKGGLPDHLAIPPNTSFGANTCTITSLPDSVFLFDLLSLSCLPPSFLSFWQYNMACGTVVPWPGIKPWPTAVKAQNPNHWTTREFSLTCFLDGLKPSNQKMGNVFFFLTEVERW